MISQAAWRYGLSTVRGSAAQNSKQNLNSYEIESFMNYCRTGFDSDDDDDVSVFSRVIKK